VVVLEGGKEVTVTSDDAYIVQSIRDPNSQVVKGFQAIMPAQPTMSDQDIAHIIAYIKTLK
jgi:cytochrome c oxidase subunit 2